LFFTSVQSLLFNLITTPSPVKRREQRYDSTRQLDVLANLNLGLSDDEQDDEDNADIVRGGISQFAAMLPPPTSSEPLPPRNQKRSKKRKSKRKVASKNEGATETTPNKRLKSHWADKCMYAELLEMKPEASWDHTDGGLPDDLELNWTAVSGVPVGKRCLAITYHSSGVAGLIPNTILRSRVIGKHLLPPFPSILPSNTVLDCILDEKWQQNGILHVLDVLKWKGQDIADCEAAFRFWWRDTRMSELSLIRSSPVQNTPSSSQLQLNFPYPTSFIPIPYHPDTSLSNLMSTIIPLARSPRIVSIVADSSSMSSESMQVDAALSDTTVQVEIKSEGLLLYVSQATYEPSTSPLSCWIPSVSENHNTLDLFETLVFNF